MSITNSTTSGSAAAASRNWSVPGESTPSSAPPSNDLATKEVFLQLLVSQIKNQNPLNPMDGAEFLGQLSQFTQVEQTLGMRQDLAQILAAIEKTAAPGTTPAAKPAA